MGPRAGMDRCGKSRPPPGFDPRTVQPVGSRFAIQTALPGPQEGTMLFRNAKYRVTQKRELLKNPTKIEEIQENKFIGRN